MFDCGENSAFSCLILTRIQAVFGPKFLSFVQILEIIAFKGHVFPLISSPLTFIFVFNLSVIDFGENSSFYSLFFIRIQTIFPLKFLNFHQTLQIFPFKRHVSPLISSPLTYICVFNRIVFDCRENSAFSSVILTRIQAVFGPKFLNFHQILQIFTFKCHVFPLICSALTFICVFNIVVLDCRENSAFSSVIITRIHKIFSPKNSEFSPSFAYFDL